MNNNFPAQNCYPPKLVYSLIYPHCGVTRTIDYFELHEAVFIVS